MDELQKKRVEKAYQEFYKHGKLDLRADTTTKDMERKKKLKLIHKRVDK